MKILLHIIINDHPKGTISISRKENPNQGSILIKDHFNE